MQGMRAGWSWLLQDKKWPRGGEQSMYAQYKVARVRFGSWGGGMFELYMKIVLMFGSIDESEACFETFHTLVNYSNSVGIF